MNIGRLITIEYGEGNELNRHFGKRATVLKVVGVFVIIDVDGVGVRGCLLEFVQPMPTAEEMALRFSQRYNGEV